jgi:predicted double-glycine peptidase
MDRSPFLVGKLPYLPLTAKLSRLGSQLLAKRILILLLVCLTAGFWQPLPAEAAEVMIFLQGGGIFTKPVQSIKDRRMRQVVPQTLDYSCGAAALATLLRYHFGYQVTETDAILGMFKHGEQEKIRRRGFSMLDMKRFVLRKGLQAKGYRVEDINLLKQVDIPVITLIETNNYKHFVVIRRLDDRFVYVSDPSWGNRKIALADFQKYWTQAILVLYGVRQGTPEGLYCEAADESLPKHQAIRYEALLGHRFAMDPTNTMIFFTQFTNQTPILLIQPASGF